MQALPTEPPQVPQEVIDHIRLVISQTRILISVTCGVYVWEWITNLSAEYDFIWKSRIGPLNIVFLLLRYYTFVALGVLAWIAFWEGDNMKQCEQMVLLLPYLPLVLFALANVIVIARVYAMWDKDKRILALLIAFLDNAYLLYWIMIIIFDTVVLSLSLLKLVMLWKANGYMSNLVRLLFRDQIIFYILTFTANVTNIIVYYADRAGGGGKDFLSPVTAGITSMAICRVVLNLRREAIKQTTFVGSSRRSAKQSHQQQFSGVVDVPAFPAPRVPNYISSQDAMATLQNVQAQSARDVEKQDQFDRFIEEPLEQEHGFHMQAMPRRQ